MHTQEVVPLYFRQSRLSSFKRQLNLYGFELISNGPSRGAYFHELFQKDKPSLCRRMRRIAVKVAPNKKQQEQEANAKTSSAEDAAGNAKDDAATGTQESSSVDGDGEAPPALPVDDEDTTSE